MIYFFNIYLVFIIVLVNSFKPFFFFFGEIIHTLNK